MCDYYIEIGFLFAIGVMLIPITAGLHWLFNLCKAYVMDIKHEHFGLLVKEVEWFEKFDIGGGTQGSVAIFIIIAIAAIFLWPVIPPAIFTYAVLRVLRFILRFKRKVDTVFSRKQCLKDQKIPNNPKF